MDDPDGWWMELSCLDLLGNWSAGEDELEDGKEEECVNDIKASNDHSCLVKLCEQVVSLLLQKSIPVTSDLHHDKQSIPFSVGNIYYDDKPMGVTQCDFDMKVIIEISTNPISNLSRLLLVFRDTLHLHSHHLGLDPVTISLCHNPDNVIRFQFQDGFSGSKKVVIRLVSADDGFAPVLRVHS